MIKLVNSFLAFCIFHFSFFYDNVIAIRCIFVRHEILLFFFFTNACLFTFTPYRYKRYKLTNTTTNQLTVQKIVTDNTDLRHFVKLIILAIQR